MIQVSAPAGDFFLDEVSRRPLVLLSGGVGLTPMVSMLEHLVGRGTPPETWYVHAALGGRQHAMKQHIRMLRTGGSAVRLSAAPVIEHGRDKKPFSIEPGVAGL